MSEALRFGRELIDTGVRGFLADFLTGVSGESSGALGSILIFLDEVFLAGLLVVLAFTTFLAGRSHSSIPGGQ